ncbi:MAG: O-methyltransferase [Bacteroidia bacterium]|nr:O-methyltransferase [Bacteroidia bacterium]
MEFIDDAIKVYCEKHSEEEGDLLKKLNRETNLKVNQPRMLSGHLQGRFLSFISKIIQPKNILEIGTYTGYSALCLAEGLTDNGKLITIDSNEETNFFAKKYFNESIYKSKIELLEGQALTIIPTLNIGFDLVFIDADKKNYYNYFKAILDKINSGGLIIADNVLWSGKVVMEVSKMDADTLAIHEFNEAVNKDERVESLLLPVRDGLMILRKK